MSPAAMPLVIATRSPSAMPTLTARTLTVLSAGSTRYTNEVALPSIVPFWIAAAGTMT